MRYLLVLSMAALTSAGLAATTFFTDEAVWSSHVTNVASFDFEGIGAPDEAISFGEGPLTVGPATFSTNFSTLFWIGKDFGGSGTGYFNNMSACASAQGLATKLTVAFDAPVHAFGMVYNNFDGFGGHISLANGAGTDFNSLGFGAQAFFGFVSDEDVTGLDVSFLPQSGFNVARFQTGTPDAVPEPASLLVLGLGGLVVARRRRR
ncbi:MAG: PEP-CTERM sorting domain-containing protein [Fimbriimonadaceae bacterium]|nr:PEP-CTERM sorting domain-containing protein [Fimbriimonadaceae bacterium]